MNRLLILLFVVSIGSAASAQESDQEETPKGGFKIERMFTGGNINLGYFNGVTALGATPQLGYSITNWLDAGVLFGFTYTSQGDQFGTTYRQTILGPGAFVRIFPVNFIFATAQFEHNFLRNKIIYSGGSDVYKADVNSLLVGLGYTNGRDGSGSGYYYFSVSVDVLNDRLSPYRDFRNQIYPVVNAGLVIPLFQGRNGSSRKSRTISE